MYLCTFSSYTGTSIEEIISEHQWESREGDIYFQPFLCVNLINQHNIDSRETLPHPGF